MERLARNITKLIQYNDSNLSELDIKKIQLARGILGRFNFNLFNYISIFHSMKYL